MAKKHELSAMALRKYAKGKYCDGGGLWLIKTDLASGYWVLRYSHGGRRREMGLGSITSVSLKAAREAAEKWKGLAVQGLDPVAVREADKRAASRTRPLLGEVAKACFEARKGHLKRDGEAGRWFSPLELHVLPKIGGKLIEDITRDDVKLALEPIWNVKAETARKAANRLQLVMKHGAAMGLDIDLLAVEQARALLGAQRNTRQHIPAMPWSDVPAFFASLEDGGVTALCLQFMILTACRSGEARMARWHELDLMNSIWVIPADRMKNGRMHRVPLSDAALLVLETVKPLTRDGLVFPSPRAGCISDMATGMLMRRRGLQFRPHGFRSSFRDWCAEETDAPREVAEMCLAHHIGSNAELAYRRTDYLDRRKRLMDGWALHVTS